MTGIQALEPISPDLPMRAGHVQSIAFEYERHGTKTLLGEFNVATGVIIDGLIQETRTEIDFVVSIKCLIEKNTETGITNFTMGVKRYRDYRK